MRGNSASFTKSILSNPLVWIGWVLTWFTLHYETKEHTFDLFYRPETFRNLIIGAAVYVSFFKRQYQKGGEKLDMLATFLVIYETFFTILLVWVLTLGVIVNYQVGGELYKETLRQKYEKIKNSEPTQSQEVLPLLEVSIKQQAGKNYRIVAQPEGAFLVTELAG